MPTRTERLDRDRSVLLVVDIQERLAPHIHDRDGVVARSAALIAAARRFRIPRLLTEHCVEQIGPVIAPLRELFAPQEIYGKTCFGALDHPDFEAIVRGYDRPQIVIAGIETHVCVLQTTLGLASRGFQVFVAADAVGSRTTRQADRAHALERMRAAGATLAGTETLLFEWTRAGDDAAFRDVLAIVKQLPG